MAFVSVAGNQEPERAEELYFEGPGGVEGKGGVRLRAIIAGSTRPATPGAPPRGTVILCPGRTEFIEKYFEVISELQSRGFVVFCMDWRGQGLSGRETADPLKGHLSSLDDPVTDLFTALRLFKHRLPRPHVILAHSMGGAIALRGLQFNKIGADAAFFCAPMWGIRNLKDLAINAARFMDSIGMGEAFVFGVQTKWKREAFKKNPVTRDVERFRRAQGLIRQEPRLALAGPTWAWVAAAANAIEQFRVHGALAHLRLPVTVLSAEADVLVENSAHVALAKAMPDARHVLIKGAKHELLMEIDSVRAHVWAEFDALVARLDQAGGAGAAHAGANVASASGQQGQQGTPA
jgi:lysophospholipase